MARKTNLKDLDTLSGETASQRILLEEYRSLQSRYLNLQVEGATRLNFFITAASFSLGGLLVFGGNNNLSELYFRIALLVVLIVLGVLNWYICMFFTQRDVLIDRYERGLIRIRRYFIKLDPLIEEFFVTRVIEAPTHSILRNNSGMRRAAQVIESFLLGLAIIIALTFTTFAPEIAMLAGTIAVFLIFMLLELIAQRQYKKAVVNVEQKIKSQKIVNKK